MAERDGFAIVGMAAVFPGAADLAALWDTIRTGADAIGDVPATRWDPVFFDPSASDVDRFYCRRGGFVDGLAAIDPVAMGIMPVAAASAEPDQMLALHVATRAIEDAGGIASDRAAVILGRGGYITPGMARQSDRVRTAQQVVTTLAELAPELDPATLDRIRRAFQDRAGDVGLDAIGLVPNLAASRVANRLDLRGPAYTIDAACASSLIAVDHGCRELASGRCDVVLAGGVHVCHDVTLWSVFTRLGALSRSQAIRPFDRRADGLLMGEGAGIVVLKRLADALRAGDRVYAVIRGTGVSSDGRESSPLRPRVDGQVAAIDAAWRDAGRDPATVGLVEAHGTATPLGDETELRTLARCFGAATGERAVLGSVKSQIGHAMPAAGAAGLIKAALAVHHGVLPPTLHCEEPHEALAHTRFRVIGAAEPWGALDRRAGISAFGFGGINAHVVIEAPEAPARPARRVAREALVLAAKDADALRAALDEPGASGGTGPARLVVLDPTPERRALARKVVERGRPWRGSQDVWFTPRGLAHDGGKLALLFPGLEAAFAPDLGELGAVPDAVLAAREHGDAVRRGPGVFDLGRLLAERLQRAGVRPDAVGGHSVGEWTAMVASEMVPAQGFAAFRESLPDHLETPDVVFAAAGCGGARAEAALEGLADVAVSHDNCPHQSILCGRIEAVGQAVERLRGQGVLCQELPFRSGFHSPLFADWLGPHREHIARLPLQAPRVPVWSATTCAPYPADAAAVRALMIDHLVRPVRFASLVQRLYDEGFRGFVQVGVGSLVGFVDDTLRGHDHLAVAGASTAPGALARLGAALYAEGWPVDLAALGLDARHRTVLDLGTPLVRLDGAVPPISTGPVADVAGSPILAELAATLREAAEASHAVVSAWRAAGPRTTRRTLSVESVPDLLDHCFYRQPGGWPSVPDRYPVAPMTMMVAMMVDAARVPGRVAVAVEDVRADRWLAVAPAVEVTIRAEPAGDVVQVEIEGYARATVRLAATYPAPPPSLPPLQSPRPAPIAADRLYADRWLFHGPRYAGVVGLGPMGDDGVDGAIEVLPAPGALLDCAGQLMGWWVQEREAHDRLSMPVHIERIALFGDEPAAGSRVDCRVRVRDVGERIVRGDLELIAGGRTWARIDGWEDRRFDSDAVVWEALTFPEKCALGIPSADGAVVVSERWRSAASRDMLMRRYLGEAERAAYDALDPRDRRAWLLGRMAIKDAVRHHLWARGTGPLFPVEIAVTDGPDGPIAHGLQVSVAIRDGHAVARVGAAPLEHVESTP